MLYYQNIVPKDTLHPDERIKKKQTYCIKKVLKQNLTVRRGHKNT